MADRETTDAERAAAERALQRRHDDRWGQPKNFTILPNDELDALLRLAWRQLAQEAPGQLADAIRKEVEHG